MIPIAAEEASPCTSSGTTVSARSRAAGTRASEGGTSPGTTSIAPEVAFRHLQHAISFVPWRETVMEDDFDLLASMFEQVGEEERAQALREELERIRWTDRR